MNDGSVQPYLGLGLLGLVLAALIVKWLVERRRRQAFQALASKLGLSYYKKDDAIPGQYEFLEKLQQGRRQYAFNVLEGVYEGHPILAFDYTYETGSGDNKRRHCLSFFILHQKQLFPELLIYPEGWLARLGQAVGLEDIDFESSEFSRAFVVVSTDKKFAYYICHAQMMAYLLGHRDLSLELEGQCIALSFDRRLKPKDIEPRLRQLVEIHDLLPKHPFH